MGISAKNPGAKTTDQRAARREPTQESCTEDLRHAWASRPSKELVVRKSEMRGGRISSQRTENTLNVEG